MRVARVIRSVFVVLTLAGALAACGSGDDQPKYVERSVEDLYNAAVNALEAENWVEAARLFDEVERQHPYSVWAIKAQLMAGYAQYEANRYDEAILALNRFVQLHPGNRDVPYAIYLKALCYYEQISDVERDQQMSQEALGALQDLVRRFPDSKYARDARLKIDLTRDHLAGKEMEVGRYYLTRGDYLAAINRFRAVVDKYQTTTHVPEALHRLVGGLHRARAEGRGAARGGCARPQLSGQRVVHGFLRARDRGGRAQERRRAVGRREARLLLAHDGLAVLAPPGCWPRSPFATSSSSTASISHSGPASRC